MKPHIVQWAAPAPLWSKFLSGAAAQPVGSFNVPAILRFASDNFMQDYLDALATDPRKLGEFRAVRETWRGKLPQPAVPLPARSFALSWQRLGSTRRRPANTGDGPAVSSDASNLPYLKLYQPAHLRHYLISTSLVCQQTGLPDRHVDAGRNERVSFVIRRLFSAQGNAEALPGDSADEYAWVALSGGNAWVKVIADDRTSEKVVLDAEERLPLFPARFTDDDLRARRLFAGVIPVGKREAYLGAQRLESAKPPDQPPGTTKVSARKILLRKLVIEPWKQLVAQAALIQAKLAEQIPGQDTQNPVDEAKTLQSAREQIQVTSWLILLDFAEFLQTHIPDLWAAVLSGTPPASGPVGDAYSALAGADATLGSDLINAVQLPSPTVLVTAVLDALRKYGNSTGGIHAALKEQLEKAAGPYSRDSTADRSEWPDFLFPLADPAFASQAPFANDFAITLKPDETADLVETPPSPLDKLAVALVRALPADPAGPEPEIPAAAQKPENNRDGVFLIRCVYERPACGPLQQDVVSDPTERIELAGFFDPDAPARPIRIGLPIDTTPAGLRKFDKNTAFVISDVLCGQIQRVKGLGLGDLIRSVLPWPLHKDLSVGEMKPCGSDNNANFGMICSLSIPIITLCALILLLMIVLVLDFIFRWMPFFIICFPVPGLKAKK